MKSVTSKYMRIMNEITVRVNNYANRQIVNVLFRLVCMQHFSLHRYFIIIIAFSILFYFFTFTGTCEKMDGLYVDPAKEF